MKKFKSFFILLFICAVVFGGVFFIYLAKSKKELNPDQFIQDKKSQMLLISYAREVQKLWNEPDDSRAWESVKNKCLSDLAITQDFDNTLLRCNPELIACVAKYNKHAKYDFKKNKDTDLIYQYVSKNNSKIPDLNLPGYLFNIVDKESGKSLEILLEDNCTEVYLEQRSYAYGEEIKGQNELDFKFDNYDRHLYIDTRLVTNFDINQWIIFGDSKETKGLKTKSGNDLFLPVINLKKEQMMNFCSFKEKQLMMAHIFDAATFLPMNLTVKDPEIIRRSPYYWTKKASEYNPNCSLIYTKECLGERPFKLNSSGPTWAGVFDSLGGVMEAFRNPIDPESNLKASSYYYDKNSSWHKLGFRAFWDGNGNEYRNFNFRGLSPFIADEAISVGFRCMRESK